MAPQIPNNTSTTTTTTTSIGSKPSQKQKQPLPMSLSNALVNGGRDPADELLALIETFAASPSFRELKTLRRDVAQERESSRCTEIAYGRNLDELKDYKTKLEQKEEQLDRALTDKRLVETQLQAQLRKTADQAASIEDKDAKVQKMVDELMAKDQRIAVLERIRQERDAIKEESALRGEQLACKTEALRNVKEQLEELQAFRATMQQLDDETKRSICQALEISFQDAHRFMEEHLDQDLDEGLLNNLLAWEDIRNNASFQHITPLCASNSPAARRMRVAAGLAAYGKALNRYLFKPVYMTSCNGEVDHMLSALWKDDPPHEFFVRSVLLKVLPPAQNKKKLARVKEVVDQVHRDLDLFIGQGRREAFKAGLEVLCERVSDCWMQIQHLQERVRPSFSLSYRGLWRPLPDSPSLPGKLLDKTTSAVARTSPASVTAAVAAASSASSASQNKNVKPPPDMGQPRRHDAGKVVWPSFLYQHPQDEDEDEELLLPGYLLTDAQTADAQNEDESPRRLARRSNRNKEQAGGKKRRDSGIFLTAVGGSDASGMA